VTSLPDLAVAIREARLEDLPAIVGQLREAELLAELRLRNATPNTNGNGDASEDRWLGMPEVAGRLGITEHQAREMGRRGELPVTRIGERHVRVSANALADWMRRATLSRLRER